MASVVVKRDVVKALRGCNAGGMVEGLGCLRREWQLDPPRSSSSMRRNIFLNNGINAELLEGSRREGQAARRESGAVGSDWNSRRQHPAYMEVSCVTVERP